MVPVLGTRNRVHFPKRLFQNIATRQGSAHIEKCILMMIGSRRFIFTKNVESYNVLSAASFRYFPSSGNNGETSLKRSPRTVQSRPTVRTKQTVHILTLVMILPKPNNTADHQRPKRRVARSIVHMTSKHLRYRRLPPETVEKQERVLTPTLLILAPCISERKVKRSYFHSWMLGCMARDGLVQAAIITVCGLRSTAQKKISGPSASTEAASTRPCSAWTGEPKTALSYSPGPAKAST